MKKIYINMMLSMLTIVGFSFASQAQISYSYDWETAQGWTSGGSSGTYFRTTTSPCNGTGSARSNTYFGGNSTLTSPSVGTSNGGTVSFSFAYKVVQYSDVNVGATPTTEFTIDVLYGATASGPWTNALTIDNSNHTATAACETKIATFNPIVGATFVRFEVNAASGTDLYAYFDDVSITQGAAPTCVAPSALTATSITGTSAVLGWTDNTGGSASLWDVEIGGAGFTPSGTPTDPGVTNTFNITTLAANTPYSYYVRADCGGSDESSWTGPFSFSTPCNSFPVPWNDSFETNTVGGDNSTEPECWTWETFDWVIGEDGVTTSTYNRAARTGTKFVYINWNGDDWMMTPGLDLTAGVDYTFSFYVITDGGTGFDLEVGVNTSASSTGITSIATETDIVNTTYQLKTYTYTAATTATYYFGVNGSGNGSPWYMSFDDFNVSVTPTCIAPTALTVVATTGSTADLDWTDNSGAGLFDIEVGAAGFTPSGVPTTAGITTTPHQVTGLTPTSPYEYYVRADCGGSDESTWSGPFAFSTGQIPVSVFPYMQDWEAGQGSWQTTNGTETNQWHVGTATNNGGTQALYVSDDGGTSHTYSTGDASVVHAYRDFQISAGNPFIELSFDWLADGENCCDRMRVYIAPTSFTPTSGTEMTTSGTAPTGIIQLGGTFNDQLTYITETYLLDPSYDGQSFRLIFEWRNDGSVGTSPPAAVDNINVVVASCGSPTNLSFSGVTTTTGDIDWDAFATETNWNVQFDTTGFALGTGTTYNVSVASDTTLSGLDQYTTYDVYVQAECGTNDTSDWVGPITFMTDPICPNPTGLNATIVNADSIVLAWTNGGTEVMWNVEWGNTGFMPGAGTTVAFDTNPDTLVGMPAGSVLDIYIQADCGGGTNNPWFGPIQVATPILNDSTCDAVDLLLDSNYVYSNIGATTQIGETRGTGTATAYNTVWFTFTAPASGAVEFDLDNSDFDTYSTLYEVVDCDDFATFTALLGSDPEMFEACALTPGTIYYLQVGGWNNSSEGIIDITINDLAIDAGTFVSADVCAGSSLDLSTTIMGAEMGGNWMETSPNLGAVTGNMYNSSAFQAAGMYQVEYRVTNVCLYDSILVDVNVAGSSNAGTDGTISQECNFGTVNLFNGLTGTVDLGGTWYNATMDTVADANVDFNGEAAGSYVYTYVADNGTCSADTSMVTIDLIDCTTIGENEGNGAFSIYPNPSTGTVFLKNEGNEDKIVIEVSDINGKMMTIQNISLNKGEVYNLDLNTNVKGIYFIRIKTNSGIGQHKVIVQ